MNPLLYFMKRTKLAMSFIIGGIIGAAIINMTHKKENREGIRVVCTTVIGCSMMTGLLIGIYPDKIKQR